ncbi:hypothetical protein R1sor_018604 [Riccia sorocarpa]|uniref:Uncharacterized protein n=1 Tax=Riccia sorocarpa TaxID=122646 RepID=A0ABD3ICV9_9MARC
MKQPWRNDRQGNRSQETKMKVDRGSGPDVFTDSGAANDKAQAANPMEFHAWVSFQEAERRQSLMLEEELAFLPTLDQGSEESEEDIREIDLDVEKAARRLGQLRRTAIILQALKSASSRDRVVSWVRETIVLRNSVRISQVKALGRREFLILL